ncbi:flagellar hook-length control protein FliK [Marinobacterium maritimum]|uniref:flagellar hook-length control protein FliK n=1 Tax=Marinobacterium maritimum TaxID=500162 RepID=UPI0031E3CEC9
MLPKTTIPNSSTPSGSSTKAAAIDQLLPAGGRDLAAVVKQVATGGTDSQVFRIQVEANNRLLELITRAPLNTGDRITLSRSPAGELQLSLSTPAPAATASVPARPALLLQAIATQAVQLQQSLPLNMPQAARVISSIPAQASSPSSPPAGTPAPAARGNSTTAGSPATTTAVSASSAQTAPAAPAPQTGTITGTTTETSASPAKAQSTPAAATQSTQSTQGREQPQSVPDNRPSSSLPEQRPASGGQSPQPTSQQSSQQASPPPTTGGARAQVYSAQLQQVSQLGETLKAGSASNTQPSTPAGTGEATQAPATGAQAAAPSRTASPPTPPAGAATPAPPPSGSSSAVAPDAKAPAAQAGSTASSANSPSAAREPANTPPPPARVSLTGNALLQTLGQQQPRQPAQHLVQLSVENQQLQLISPRPLQAGQQVTLTRVSDQQVQLQASVAAELPGRSPAAQNAMQQALREALPQQIPFGDALNQLVQLSQTPAARGQGAIGQLVQSMLSLFSVTPGSPDADQAIQRNLQQGGLLTESQLARSGGSDKPPADLKQQLGQLLKAAEQLPPEPRQQMQRLVDALQARTTSQQVSSLQAWQQLPDGGQERVFQLDLPIRQADRHDTAELTISEQRRPDPEGDWQSSWSVALNFDLQQQGSVDVRLSLQEGWRLQLQFWAEAAATLRRIEQQLPPFTQELHQKGFIVDHIQARQGRPHQPKLNDIQRRLVDVHT